MPVKSDVCIHPGKWLDTDKADSGILYVPQRTGTKVL